MEARLDYRVRALIDASSSLKEVGVDPWSIRALLSPYDYESIVYEGVKHPRVTVWGVGGGEWGRLNTGSAVAAAGGLLVARAGRGFRVEAGGVKHYASKVAVASAPGAAVAAFYVNRYSSIAYSTPLASGVIEEAYRGEPAACSIGYRLAACVFRDGRSLLVAEGRLLEVGVPVEAVALHEGKAIVESGGWLLEVDGNGFKPLVKARGVFAGLTGRSLLLNTGGRLSVLDGASLTPLMDAVDGSASGHGDVIVVDKGVALEIHESTGVLKASIPKTPEARCWATPAGVLCCRRAFCGLVEPGVEAVRLEPVVNGVRAVRLESTVPVWVNGEPVGESRIIRVDGGVLKPAVIRVEARHLLGDIVLEAVAPGVKPSVTGEAVAWVSETGHSCGGIGVLEVRVEHGELPPGVSLYATVDGRRLRVDRVLEACIQRPVHEVVVEAVDDSGGSVEVARIPVETVEARTPRLGYRVIEEGEGPLILIETDAVVERALVCSRNGCTPVKPVKHGDGYVVKPPGGRLPEYIIVKLSWMGFKRLEKISLDGEQGRRRG